MIPAQFGTALARLRPSWALDSITDVAFLPGGYSNENFVFRYQAQKYVLRIPRRAQPYVDHVQESRWYAKLPAHLTALPLAFEEKSGLMLTPWIEGKLLIDAWPDLNEEHLIGYLQRLHQQLPATIRRYDVGELLAAYGCVGPEFTAESVASEALQPSHNDLNPWNILVTPTGWITLDWEFAGLNDPLFDLVSLHQGLNLSAENLPELAARLLRKSELDPDISQRLSAAQRSYWLREFAWADFQLREGNRRAEIVAQKTQAASKLKLT